VRCLCLAMGVAYVGLPAVVLAGPRAPIDVTIQVAEWAGVARDAGSFTGGVPLPDGAIRNVRGLRLINAKGEAIPAQFAPLVKDRRGFVRWVLADGQLDLDAGAATTLRLTRGENPAPKVALRCQSRGDLVEVTTGPLRFAVGRRYNFLDSVWIDGNGDGRFSKGERIVVPTAEPNVLVVEADTGRTYTSLGARARTPRFEYKGPLRAVLVMEGDLADAGGNVLLGYRTRITAFAGKTTLLIEHSLRNSRKAGTFHVKLKRSELGLGLAADLTQYHIGADAGKTIDGTLLEKDEVVVHQRGPAKAGRRRYQACAEHGCAMTLTGARGRRQLHEGPTAPGWVFASSAARGVFLFDRDFVADAPGRIVQRWGRLVYEDIPEYAGDEMPKYSSGGFWLADSTHEVCRLVLDFAARSADKIQPVQVMARVRSPLVALPDPEHVARTEALAGPFATVDDEIKVYRDIWKWNWSEKRRPKAPPKPETYVYWDDIHGRSEGDDLRDAALEMVRTRRPGFYHRAAAWARYYACEAVWRSDGFDWQDRTAKDLTTAALRTKPDRENVRLTRAGKFDGSHNYGAGLVDWYCLTGDVEALEAAIDYAEWAAAAWAKRVPGKTNVAYYGQRGFGRMLQGLCRVYEATADPRWFAAVKHMADLAVKCPSKDPRGFLANFSVGPPDTAVTRDLAQQHGYDLTKRPPSIASWQAAIVSHALWRAHALTGNEDLRDLVIGYARMSRRHMLHRTYRYGPYYAFFDFPTPGSVLFRGLDAAPKVEKVNPAYTTVFTDCCSRGYDLTGDASLLASARTFWTRGSKGYWQMPIGLKVPEKAIGRMLHDGNLGMATGSYWAGLLFRHTARPRADAEPPSAVTDLAARRRRGTRIVTLTWTAPADRGGGDVAIYQVKHAAVPIVAYRDFDYAKDRETKCPWWYAVNLTGEPEPRKPGTKQRMLVKDLPAGTHHFAIRTRDAANNESGVSNVVKVEIK